MAGDISVTGANQLAALTKRLKATGQTELKKDLLRGLRTAAKPLVQVARDAAHDNLPHTGGLNEVVASSKFAVRTRTSGRNPGVRVIGVSPHNIGAMDRGRLRHPVFGNSQAWVTQQIPPGWWTDAMQAQAPAVRQKMLAALADAARRATT